MSSPAHQEPIPDFIRISEPDLQRLPVAGGPLLFICNRLDNGIDEAVLEGLLRPRFSNLSLLTLKKSLNPFVRVRDSLLAERNYDALLTRFKAIIAEEGHQSCVALPIDFDPPAPGNVLHQINMNRFFRFVRNSGFTVVLLYQHAETSANPIASFAQTIQKQVGQIIGYTRPAGQITIRVSTPIRPDILQHFEKAHQVRRFIQSRLYAMSTDVHHAMPDFFKKWISVIRNPQAVEAVAEAGDLVAIQAEIEQLTADQSIVVEQSSFQVFVAKANQIPAILAEIGRLREITFRAVGEGTGKSIDLDEFDLYYHQLIIWDKNQQCIVGGYRVGCGEDIFRAYGKHGFYISTLFRIKKQLEAILPISIELGRSYIIPDYQRKPLPLFLLWKGILAFLLRNPQYQYLFGPVSISNLFSEVSKSVMVEFLKQHFFDKKLARHLRPRKPFKVKTANIDTKLIVDTLDGDLANLDKFIESIEPTQMRMPVLLKQYIRQNARFIGFNVDPHFSDCLDGFMILNLKNLPETTLDNLQKER